MKFIAPIRTVSEANARECWQAKARRVAEQRFVTGAVLRAGRVPALPCIVTLTRIAPRALDDDNGVGALKAVRDEVAWVLGLPIKNAKRRIADDRDPRVEWKYAQRRGKAKEYAVEIQIEAKP
jgi:hypothetical protein